MRRVVDFGDGFLDAAGQPHAERVARGHLVDALVVQELSPDGQTGPHRDANHLAKRTHALVCAPTSRVVAGFNVVNQLGALECVEKVVLHGFLVGKKQQQNTSEVFGDEQTDDIAWRELTSMWCWRAKPA